ncbi:Uncharacterised protein [Yokenella regensburgei]|nr:Uncharacterised protein [Yokenella regensburgei]
MLCHRTLGRFNGALRIGFRFTLILFPRPALWQVAVQRIVRAGLVGDHVRAYAAFYQLRHDISRVAAQRDGHGFAFCDVFFDTRQRIVERGCLLIHIAGAQTEIDTALLAFNVQGTGTREGCRQRLRAAHTAQTGG